MISFCVRKDRQGSYRGFSCRGHAGYDVHGQDIVCASVSILVINTLNALEGLTEQKFSVDMEEGQIDMHLSGPLLPEAILLLDALMMGMEGIRSAYPKHVDFRIDTGD